MFWSLSLASRSSLSRKKSFELFLEPLVPFPFRSFGEPLDLSPRNIPHKEIDSYPAGLNNRSIPYDFVPPPRLLSRLRAFGSAKAVESFEKTQRIQARLSGVQLGHSAGSRRGSLSGAPYEAVEVGIGSEDEPLRYRPNWSLLNVNMKLTAQIDDFERIVHDEIG
jgi:hypothetical protein